MPAFRSLSLLLTGLADVWTSVREEARGTSARGGLALMVISAACFAGMAAFAKKLLPETPIQAVVLSRGVLMTALFAAAAARQGVSLVGTRPGLLLTRGLLGYAALSCYFASVQHLPLGDAVLLQYSHPIYVAAAAPLVLGERTTRAQWVLIALAVLGVALIVQPSGDLRPWALVGVVGSVFSGSAYMAVRKLSRTEHPLTILVWFPLATIPFSLVGAVAAGPASWPSTGTEVAGHALVFLSALVGQITLTHGLARVGAARATAVTLTGPVFGLAFGWALFGSLPTTASLSGTVLVLTAIGLLGSARRPG